MKAGFNSQDIHISTRCLDLSRQHTGPTLLSPVEEEAHSGAQVFQVQIRQEAPLKLRLHPVPARTAIALQKSRSRLEQQPISQLPHTSAVLTGQGLPPPEAEMKHVRCHTSGGALQRKNTNTTAKRDVC